MDLVEDTISQDEVPIPCRYMVLLSAIAFAAIQWLFFPYIGRRYIYSKFKSADPSYLLKFEMKILSSFCVLIVAGPTPFIFFSHREIFPNFNYFHPTSGIQIVSSIYFGYLISDSFTLLYSRKTNNEFWAWGIHHIMGVIACLVAINANVFTLGICFMLWTEFPTMAVNNIFIFPVVGLGDYAILNSYIIIILWIIFREIIAWWIHLFIQIRSWNQFFELNRPYYEIFFCFTIPFGFGLLNTYWLLKIIKGHVKLVKKKREKESKNYRRKLY